MAAATRKCILDSQEFSVCAIFVLERSISDYGAKVSRRISRERKKKKKKKEVSWVAKSTLVLLPIWRMR